MVYPGVFKPSVSSTYDLVHMKVLCSLSTTCLWAKEGFLGYMDIKKSLDILSRLFLITVV
jgi:hypothetical protein